MLPEDMGAVQSLNAEIVVEPFDLHYWAAMKIQRIAYDQPEVVSIGLSRGTQYVAPVPPSGVVWAPPGIRPLGPKSAPEAMLESCRGISGNLD